MQGSRSQRSIEVALRMLRVIVGIASSRAEDVREGLVLSKTVNAFET